MNQRFGQLCPTPKRKHSIPQFQRLQLRTSHDTSGSKRNHSTSDRQRDSNRENVISARHSISHELSSFSILECVRLCFALDWEKNTGRNAGVGAGAWSLCLACTASLWRESVSFSVCASLDQNLGVRKAAQYATKCASAGAWL